jgi:hypothetical protein
VKKLFLTSALALIGALAISSAHAQTWVEKTKADGRNTTASVYGAVITSGTTLAPVAVRDMLGSVRVHVSATTNVSVSIQRLLKDGTLLSEDAVAVGTTPTSLTIAAPALVQAIRVSPTSALTGVNAVHANVINAK